MLQPLRIEDCVRVLLHGRRCFGFGPHFFEPFAAQSGAKVLQDGPTENSKIKAQVDSKNVTWDVVDSTNVFTAKNCGKLFMPLDTSIVDISKLPAGTKTDDCSVPAMGYGLIVVYNTKKYGANPPKTRPNPVTGVPPVAERGIWRRKKTSTAPEEKK